MTIAEKVRKAVADYLLVSESQVTDDMVIRHCIGFRFFEYIYKKTGLAYIGPVGDIQTMGQLIARFEKVAKTSEPDTS